MKSYQFMEGFHESDELRRFFMKVVCLWSFSHEK